MNVILDVAAIVGATLGGVAAIIGAVWSRQAKRSAKQAVNQTNGVLQEPLAAIRDGVASLGHQVGEVRADMGRMDERLSTELRDVRRRDLRPIIGATLGGLTAVVGAVWLGRRLDGPP